MKIIASFFTFLICAILISSLAFGNDVQKTVENNNAFGLDLYQELEHDGSNIFFSPFSISTALAMAYAGAKEQTESEIADVLHFTVDQSRLHSAFNKLLIDLDDINEHNPVIIDFPNDQNPLHPVLSEHQIELLTLDKNSPLAIHLANSLWIQKGIQPLKSFLELDQKYYDSQLNIADFENNPSEAIRRINRWVDNETGHKINEIINQSDISQLTRLVLCSALYFKSTWQAKFNKNMTDNRSFFLSPQDKILTPMMHQESVFKYNKFQKFSAIELPFEGNEI